MVVIQNNVRINAQSVKQSVVLSLGKPEVDKNGYKSKQRQAFSGKSLLKTKPSTQVFYRKWKHIVLWTRTCPLFDCTPTGYFTIAQWSSGIDSVAAVPNGPVKRFVVIFWLGSFDLIKSDFEITITLDIFNIFSSGMKIWTEQSFIFINIFGSTWSI